MISLENFIQHLYQLLQIQEKKILPYLFYESSIIFIPRSDKDSARK